MALDTAAAILATRSSKKCVSFMVDELGQEVLLRLPTVADLDEYLEFANSKAGKGGRDMAPKILQMFLCDSSGARLFTDDQLGELAGMDARAAMRICKHCQKLLVIEDAEIERMEGN